MQGLFQGRKGPPATAFHKGQDEADEADEADEVYFPLMKCLLFFIFNCAPKALSEL